MSVTFLTNEDKNELNERIDGVSVTPTDSKYFDIDYDGLVSLKPEYRGQSHTSYASTYPYSVSDKGVGKDGSLINDLPEKIVIPEVINDTVVTGFQAGMFLFNYRVKKLVFPDTVAVVPNFFCTCAKYLVSIENTDHIEKLGERAFGQTRITKALFPKLKEMAKQAFTTCPFLQTVDIGDSLTLIPEKAFYYNIELFCVKGGNNVTSIAKEAFIYTLKLRNLPLLGNGKISNIGDNAFYNTRMQYAWDSLTGCTFGTNATPLADNTSDYWSSCTFTPCENRIGSTFHQKNPEWANNKWFESSYNYSANGCSATTMAHIYSAIGDAEGKIISFNTPEYFEDVLKQALIADGSYDKYKTAHPGNINNVIKFLQVLGYNIEVITEPLNSSALQKIYNALSEGAYIHASVGIPTDVDGGHCVTFYGVNDIGEMLCIDSSGSLSGVDIYEALMYSIPIQNMTSDNSNMIIVKKP